MAKKSHNTDSTYQQYAKIDFQKENKRAKDFAKHIEKNIDSIIEILLTYESYEVANDEIGRTLDVLNHLSENKEYFKYRCGGVTSFLPKNQPLYALTCFVLIPSLISEETCFRIPHSMRKFFPTLLKTLKLPKFFPNITIYNKERSQFLKQRTALKLDPKTMASLPMTDVVIFTGTPNHADKLRLSFDHRTLFITNGAGHNPVVISKDADLDKAVEAITDLQLYNQGQDCASPNSTLIHSSIYQKFLRKLRKSIKDVKIGHYSNTACRVGPISEAGDLPRIQELLVANRKWLDKSTIGLISASDSIVYPTIICKPLKRGGNYTEVFAPLIFAQKYDDDNSLAQYFENPHYERNAMYITLYGTSEYINSLLKKKFNNKILHDKFTILRNTHLHAAGVERGTQPYGGYGYGASNLSINGKITCKATLPQRDIYEQIIKPLEKNKMIPELLKEKSKFTKISYKDIQKLQNLKIQNNEKGKVEIDNEKGPTYVDIHGFKKNDARYHELDEKLVFPMLKDQNTAYIATLEPKHTHQIRALSKFLKKKGQIDKEELTLLLYSIAKNKAFSEKKNKKEQLEFFKTIYQLLFGTEFGPRLGQFIIDANRKEILTLLDV